MRSRLFGAAVALVVGGTFLTACHGGPHIEVNYTWDAPDANPGDGVCEVEVGSGDCSLRAALQEASLAGPGDPIQIDVTRDIRVGVGESGAPVDLGPLVLDPQVDWVALVGPEDGASLRVYGELLGTPVVEGILHVTGGDVRVRNLAIRESDDWGLRVSGGAQVTLHGSGLLANDGAGAVVEPGSSLGLVRSTVSGNGDGGVQNGGSLDLRFATVTNNTAGGILGASPATGASSVVADQATGPDCALTMVSSGHVVDTDGTCADHPDDLTVADAGLGPLTTSGYAVGYHVPADDSPLVDLIPPGSDQCGAGSTGDRDQRGAPRPVDDGCEAGAVEIRPVVGFTPGGAVHGAVVDADGRVYVTGTTNTTAGAGFVKVYERTSSTTWSQVGSFPSASSGVGDLVTPMHPAIDPSGRVHVPDSDRDRVLVFEETTPGTWAFLNEYGTDSGAGQLNIPLAVAFDSTGRSYVSGPSNGVKVFAEGPAGTWSVVGTITAPGLDHPYGVDVDSADVVHVVDTNDDTVTVFEASSPGTWTVTRSYPAAREAGEGFRSPKLITVFDDGTTHVADGGLDRIMVFDASGSFVREYGEGPHDPTFVIDSGMAFDGDGGVYVPATGIVRWLDCTC